MHARDDGHSAASVSPSWASTLTLCAVDSYSAFGFQFLTIARKADGDCPPCTMVFMPLECVGNLRSNFTSPPPHTHPTTYVITCDFQTELLSRLLLTGAHLQKWARAISLSYSPLYTLHPRVIYAIAFSAGLSGLQVH